MKSLFINMKIINKISLIMILFIGAINLFSQESNTSVLQHKCGTFNNSKRFEKNKEKIRTKFQDGNTCTKISQSGHFAIHYDTLGIDGVTNEDINGNKIPDWIDTVCSVFDEVYEIEVDKMGYRSPRTYYNSDDTLYHIYVTDCAATMAYGWTSPEDVYADNTSKWKLATSYITIDNNYSPHDTYINKLGNRVPLWGTTGVDALKVTAAHEFHHACQWMYSFAINGPNGGYAQNESIYEMSAVAMEMNVYPEIKDYQIYANTLLNNINTYNFGIGLDTMGYPFGIFFNQILQKYAPIKKYWELIANEGKYCYEALEYFFNIHNTTLAENWKLFMDYLYHCGENSIPNYGFSFAKELTTPKLNITIVDYGIHAENLMPYQLYYTQFINKKDDFFILSDTVALILTNANTDAIIAGEIEYHLVPKNCSFGSFDHQINVDNINCFPNYWLNIYPNFDGIEYFYFLKNGGEIFTAENVFPMPFDRNKNVTLYIPISDNVKIGDKVELDIFTNNNLTENLLLTATVYNEKRVVKFDARYLNSGVYIYSLKHFNSLRQGKFIIK